MVTNENTAIQIVINGYNPILLGSVNIITVKHYEIEIQKAIENKVPQKSWWQIVKRSIFDELYELFEQNKDVQSVDMMFKIQEYIEELLDEADTNIKNEFIQMQAKFKGKPIEIIGETKYTYKCKEYFTCKCFTVFKTDKNLEITG